MRLKGRHWLMLWLVGFPTGMILVLLNRWIPESPRYLLQHGRNEEARAWQTGLQAIRRVVGVKTVYDLSATPATRTRRRPGQRHLKWRWAEAVPHRTAAVTGSSAQTLLPFSVGLTPHVRLIEVSRNSP